MTTGKAKIESTLLGAVIFGLSRQHLWFEEHAPRGESDIAMKAGSSRNAFRCPQCGTLVVPFEEERY